MLTLRAPAKLNLYLRVLGRRPDGYHELDTLFERIDLADELTFAPQPDGLHLTCSDSSLSCGEDNLVLQAARLLQQVTGHHGGAVMHLAKRIPIAAGLGGGSSDAAATLVGLNQVWHLGLDQAALTGLGARLGADVPFFLQPAPFAIARGRGDVCEPLPVTCRLAHVLAIPAARVSTSEVYATGHFGLTPDTPSSSIVAHALRNGPALAGLAEGLWNDLEPEAIRRCPSSASCQVVLRELGCLGARVTGSGPAVFGLCRDVAHAHEVAAHVRERLTVPLRLEIVQTDYDSDRVPHHTAPSGSAVAAARRNIGE